MSHKGRATLGWDAPYLDPLGFGLGPRRSYKI